MLPAEFAALHGSRAAVLALDVYERRPWKYLGLMVIFRLPSVATVSFGQLCPMSVEPTTLPFTVTRLPLALLLNATCEMPVMTNV